MFQIDTIEYISNVSNGYSRIIIILFQMNSAEYYSSYIISNEQRNTFHIFQMNQENNINFIKYVYIIIYIYSRIVIMFTCFKNLSTPRIVSPPESPLLIPVWRGSVFDRCFLFYDQCCVNRNIIFTSKISFVKIV